MVIRDAQAIKLGSTDVNKIYYGTGKVYDTNKTALEGYCVQNGEPTPDNPIEIETMKGRQIIPIEKINIISTDVNDWEAGQYNQANGVKSNDEHRIRMKELVPVEPGVYYVNTFTKEYNIILRTYNENKAFISSIGNVTNGTTITVTTARYISISLWKNGDSSISYTELLQKISDKEITPYICLNSAKYVVDLKSKNLLNPTRTWENFNGTTLTLSNQQLTLNGTSTAPTSGKITDTAISSGTYTITFKEISGSHTSGKLLYIDLMNGNTKVTGISFRTDSQQTITLNNNIDNIKFGFQVSDTFSNYTFVIQLEQSSTPTTYEPYYNYELAGIKSKNLFNNKVKKINAYPNASSSDVGKKVTFSSSSATYSYVNCAYVQSGETYTLSWKQNKNPASTNTRIGVIVDENDIVLQTQNTWYSSSRVLTFTPSYSGFLILAIDINATEVQLEKGNTATTYIDFNAYADTIFTREGKWYKGSKVSKVVLDGSESGWRAVEQSSGWYRIGYDSTANIKNVGTKRTADIFCNNFYVSTTNNYNIIFHYATTLFYYLPENMTTKQAFLELLSTNNSIVYYVLNTPTEEEITAPGLIAQLNALYQAM